MGSVFWGGLYHFDVIFVRPTAPFYEVFNYFGIIFGMLYVRFCCFMICFSLNSRARPDSPNPSKINPQIGVSPLEMMDAFRSLLMLYNPCTLRYFCRISACNVLHLMWQTVLDAVSVHLNFASGS